MARISIGMSITKRILTTTALLSAGLASTFRGSRRFPYYQKPGLSVATAKRRAKNRVRNKIARASRAYNRGVR